MWVCVCVCVIKCLIWWLVALTIYSCSCCPSDTHTHTHILTLTPTHWHSVIKFHLLVYPFFVACLLRGSVKSFPNLPQTSLQSFVIPISQLGEIYDDLNSLQFTFSLWSKKFFTNIWWIRAWGVRFLWFMCILYLSPRNFWIDFTVFVEIYYTM